jgi:hypothetical protein
MVFEMHLPLQDNSITSKIVRARYIFVRFELMEATPIGMPLEGVFTRVNLLLVLQGKITRQAKETLKAFTLQWNVALFLWLRFRYDLIIDNLDKRSSSGIVGPQLQYARNIGFCGRVRHGTVAKIVDC